MRDAQFAHNSLAHQRAWENKRATFMSGPAFRQRLTWYLINYIGGAAAVAGVLYSSGSLDIDIVTPHTVIIAQEANPKNRPRVLAPALNQRLLTLILRPRE